MGTDFINYIILFAILTIMFTIIGNTNFRQQKKEFRSLLSSLLQVFDNQLGNYDFAEFDSFTNPSLQILGIFFTLANIFVFNIVIFKLIIAILANTYNVFDNKSNGLYLSKILVTRDEMSFDECYGGFLTSMPLVNVIQLPFLPVCLFLPRHHPIVKYTNILLYKLQYFVFMFVFFVYFAVFSIAMIPVAYFFAIMDKITTIN